MRFTRTLVGLATAGTLFAGYLSGVKLFTHNCSALIGSCAYLFGVPSCIYGFAFFAVLLILALEMHFTKKNLLAPLALIAFGAMLFSSYFTIVEWGEGGSFPLLAPTCFYGLIFYIIIFILSVMQIKRAE